MVLAQANQERVNFFGSSLLKASCMKPVPAWVFCSVLRQLPNFLVVGAGQALHDQAQRPDHVHANVRAARAFGGLAFAVIRIGSESTSRRVFR